MTLRRGGLVLGAIALIAAVATGSRALGVVGIGFLLAGAVTWLWTWLADSPVHVTHTVAPVPAVEGDRVRVRLEVRRTSRFPLGSMVVQLTAGRLGRRECRMRAKGRLANGAIDLGPLPRGVFALTDMDVVLGDFLGLVTVSPRVVSDPATIVVRPRLTALDGLFRMPDERLRTGVACCCGDPPASTSTRCASTSGVSRFVAFIGPRAHAEGS